MRGTCALTTILLVEDDQTIRELARMMLDADGYRVLSAGTAHEALAMLEQDPDVDLIFSDVQMPGGDGMTMVRELRRRAVTIPALLTSGMKHPDTAALPTHTGFLPKPYSHAGLLAALQRLQPAH
ncbi:response regulator [Xanthomonas sp. CFBP 8703]|jgi:two-component system chemotaxis response regulator CheY|uniref:Response regulator n=2 Tax=Xanthomonas TaxID=338 RepID=A0ABS3B8B8_9XANT|nr:MULTISPECIES: response regulator [Xanthomonas]MBD7922259.1 response regulator [Xanthomonas surreyensis]MBN6104802.1 response regulator [Xanthomonas bonasiae]MBN6113629.1 response regulator [Xanthomonas bonasiae]